MMAADPAFRLLVTILNIWKKQKLPPDIIIFLVPALESKDRVFEILGISSLKIPSASNPICEKASISNFWLKIPGFSIKTQGFWSKY